MDNIVVKSSKENIELLLNYADDLACLVRLANATKTIPEELRDCEGRLKHLNAKDSEQGLDVKSYVEECYLAIHYLSSKVELLEKANATLVDLAATKAAELKLAQRRILKLNSELALRDIHI